MTSSPDGVAPEPYCQAWVPPAYKARVTVRPPGHVHVVEVRVPSVEVAAAAPHASAVRYASASPTTVGSTNPSSTWGVPPGPMVSSGSPVEAISSKDVGGKSGQAATGVAP